MSTYDLSQSELLKIMLNTNLTKEVQLENTEYLLWSKE